MIIFYRFSIYVWIKNYFLLLFRLKHDDFCIGGIFYYGKHDDDIIF